MLLNIDLFFMYFIFCREGFFSFVFEIIIIGLSFISIYGILIMRIIILFILFCKFFRSIFNVKRIFLSVFKNYFI